MVIHKTEHIVHDNISIREALVALNKLSLLGNVLTLFILNDSFKLVGTLTDGDIRRKLVDGVSIDDIVTKAMQTDFSYLEEDKFTFQDIKKYKEKGLKLLPCLNLHGKIVIIYDLLKKKSFLPIDAVLMAGGKGERLRPLTENIPKPLLKIGKKAIIDYNIESINNFGVENIFVTVNYLKEKIEEHFKDKKNKIKVNCVREPKYLGTMGSIKFVEGFEKDTILVMNSDLFTNINYEDFYLHFLENDADMSVAAVPYSVSVPYGIFKLKEREIIGVKEKPTYNYYANSGIYLIKRKVLDLIPDNIYFDATDLIDLLIQKRKKIIRFPLVGYWIDIGKPIDYQKAKEFVKHIEN